MARNKAEGMECSNEMHVERACTDEDLWRKCRLISESEDSGIYNSEVSGSPPKSTSLLFQQSRDAAEDETKDLKMVQEQSCFEHAADPVSPEEIVRYSDTQNKLRSTSMGQSKAIILSLESLPLEDPLTSTESCTQNCHHQSLSNGKVNELLMPTPFGFHAASDRTFRDGHSHQNRVRCVSSPCLASGSRVQALNNPTLSADAGKPHAHGTTTPRQSSNGAKNSQTSTDSSKQSSDNVETASPLLEGPVHKDGGYGWIIVLGAFIVSLIIDGVSLSFGIFYPELLTYFGQGQSKTAWAGSVLSGTYSLLGPLSSGLANRFGCRLVCISGSVIATLAFLLSILSPNVEILIVTYGFVGGLGFSLMYIPSIVMVSFYFEERRALATGVTVCGSGIGTFLFAPLTEYLLSVYDWKGAMTVISALVLHGIIAGALFRPILSRRNLDPNKESQCGNLAERRSPEPGNPDCEASETEAQRQHVGGVYEQVQSTPLLAELGKNTVNLSERCNRFFVNKHCAGLEELTWKSLDHIPSERKHRRLPRIYATNQNEDNTLYRKDVFYSGSVYQLNRNQTELDCDSARRTDHHTAEKLIPVQWTKAKYREWQRTNSTLSNSSQVKQVLTNGSKRTNVLRNVLGILSQMTNFSLFMDPIYFTYALSCTLTMFGFMIPFVYLPNCVKEAGFSNHDGVVLLSILGVANTVGRVLCGWISDKRWVSPMYINASALVMTGIVTMVQPEIDNFVLLGFTAFVFGIGVAVFISLRSILMVDLIGLEKLTNGFGLVQMCQGCSLIIGPPVAGLLRDKTNSYTVPFCVAGTAILIAGFLCMPLKYLSNRKSARKLNSSWKLSA